MPRLALVVLALLEPGKALRLAPPPLASNKAAEPPLAERLQAALLASIAAVVLSSGAQPALAAGTVAKVDLKVLSYAEVTCPEALAQGRAGGALGAGAGGAGIAQKCVQVKAATTNDSGGVLEGAGVFGRVEGVKDGMSVLGNGQDGKNDAGQFAMIDKIAKGDSEIEFIFVSQQATDCVNKKYKDPETKKLVIETCPVQGTEPLIPLKFDKVKAIAYPSADRFKAYDPCEQNPFGEGCPD